MVSDRFGDGLFDDRPPGDPRRGEDPPDEDRPAETGAWDERIDERESMPWISVHVLAQFVFCPRAGVIAHQRGREEDDDRPPRAPRLDHLPDFRPAIIREALDAVRGDLWTFATYASIWVAILALIAFVHPILVGMLLLASAIYVPSVYCLVRDYLVLRGRMQLALRAKARGPDPNISAPQIVNWWELLKADYEPTMPRKPHTDRALRLFGKPHLILTHKGQRIPVIRKWRGKEVLHRKDHARCAAYAHLVETCENTTVPFVVILFGTGYDGVSVPITVSAKKAFRDGLGRARRFLKRGPDGALDPDKPRTSGLCKGCDFGKPRLYERGRSETMLGEAHLAAQVTETHDRKSYHCTCGDRFGDGVPPHEWAVALGLTD